MSSIVKVTEVIAQSEQGFDDAVRSDRGIPCEREDFLCGGRPQVNKASNWREIMAKSNPGQKARRTMAGTEDVAA